VPVLGICYGLHFIVHHMGGKVKAAPLREYGHAEVMIEDMATPLFNGLPANIQVWMSHGDEAEALPAGFHRTAITSNALAGIANDERRIWAVQFIRGAPHAAGPQLIRNFVFGFARRRATGRRRTSLKLPSRAFARRSAKVMSSVAFPAAWTRRWPRCWYTRRSAAS